MSSASPDEAPRAEWDVDERPDRSAVLITGGVLLVILGAALYGSISAAAAMPVLFFGRVLSGAAAVSASLAFAALDAFVGVQLGRQRRWAWGASFVLAGSGAVSAYMATRVDVGAALPDLVRSTPEKPPPVHGAGGGLASAMPGLAVDGAEGQERSLSAVPGGDLWSERDLGSFRYRL